MRSATVAMFLMLGLLASCSSSEQTGEQANDTVTDEATTNDTGQADSSQQTDTGGIDFPAVADELALVPTYPDQQPTGTVDVEATVDFSAAAQEYLGFGMTLQFYVQFSWVLQHAQGGDENQMLDDLFAPTGLNSRYIFVGPVGHGPENEEPPLVYRGSYYEDGELVLDNPPIVSMVEYLERYDTKVIVRPQLAPAEWIEERPHDGENVTKLQLDHYGDFAQYLIDYSRLLEAQAGYEVWGLTVQNEPDFPAQWDYVHYTPEELLTFVRDHLVPAREAAGLSRIRLVGPDTGTTWSLPSVLGDGYFTSELRQVFDIYDFHGYDMPFVEADPTSSERRLRGASELTDKPVLFEYGNATSSVDDNATGGTPWEMILTASHIHDMLTLGRASIPVWFSGLWAQPASGLLYVEQDYSLQSFETYAVPLQYQRLPKYYTVMHYSRLAPIPSRIIPVEDDDWGLEVVGFFDAASGDTMLVLVNRGMETRQTTLVLTGAAITGPFQHYRSTYTDRFVLVGDVAVEGGRIQVELPPASIHTLSLAN